MKNIGLIDADLLDNGTRHPNLALMKISGFYKKKGFKITLLKSYEEIKNFDKVYISKVFNFTKTPDLSKFKNIKIGGTGFFSDGGKNLPNKIEHHMPDYHLYDDYITEQINNGKNRNYFTDYLDYSIGFTTRGCFRKCGFCVNKKYDRVHYHSPINEFLDKKRKGIYLWDDNFLAFSNWKDVLAELEATGKPFQFRQGLDVRLMTEEKAQRFSKVKYKGDYIFAFDHIEDQPQIEKGLKIWKKHVKKTTKLYVLVAYESQDAEDIAKAFERIKVLMKYGCLPYIMRYESYKDSEMKGMYIQLARWCNQPNFFKKKSFRQFCETNQQYHKNQNTICSSLKAMNEFEEKYPEIAKKYFDLRYEDLNEYRKEKIDGEFRISK